MDITEAKKTAFMQKGKGRGDLAHKQEEVAHRPEKRRG